MKSWVLAVSLLAAAFVPAANAADLGDYDRHSYSEPRYRTPPRAYEDRDYGPPPVRRRFSGDLHGRTCARSEEVRDRLTVDGWRDFHSGDVQGNVVTVRARRPNGRLFELILHRCSGEIVEARPLEPRPFGPYAFNRPPRDLHEDRWGDTYAQRDWRWWRRGY